MDCAPCAININILSVESICFLSTFGAEASGGFNNCDRCRWFCWKQGIGFSPEELLATGEQAVGVLLGLDSDNVGGLLAKGDLCRLAQRCR